MTEGPFGDDMLPALQNLSGFLGPYVKALILATVILNPFPQLQVVPDWSTAIPAQVAQPLLVAIAAYLSGFIKFPYVDLQAKDGQWAALIGPLTSFQIVSNNVGTYFKVGLLISLAFYMPIYHAVPLPFQPWFWGLLVTFAVVAGFYAPTAKFNGPLRYGYLKYSSYFAKFYNLLLDWWFYTALFLIFSHILLPVLLLGLIATAVATWVHIYREYAEDLSRITAEADESVAKASLAAAFSRDYAATASHYETALISAAAGTRRDALIASSVRTTDFFHTATEAWAALGTVTQPVDDARDYASQLASKAYEVDEVDKPDEDSGGRSAILSQYLVERSSDALKKAEEVKAKLHVAQEAIRQSDIAKERDEKARRKAKANATAAAAAVRTLSERIKGLPETGEAVQDGAKNARRFAGQAVAAATEGEMGRARKAADAAKRETVGAVKSMETLREAMRGAHRVLLEWLEKESNDDL